MVQQQPGQVTDSFGLADCQELLTFYLYFDQSKTSRRDSVKIYLEDQRGPATVRIFFFGLDYSNRRTKFIIAMSVFRQVFLR